MRKDSLTKLRAAEAKSLFLRFGGKHADPPQVEKNAEEAEDDYEPSQAEHDGKDVVQWLYKCRVVQILAMCVCVCVCVFIR